MTSLRVHLRRLAAGTAVVGASIAVVAGDAQSAGFYVREQSTSAMGTAFAGAASMGPDASHLFYNPATIINNAPKSFTVDARLFVPDVEMNDAVAANLLGPVTGVPGTGSMADVGLAPTLFASFALSEDFSVGIGGSAPFAAVIESDPDWAGRFHVLKTDMRAYNVNPVFAWRIGEMITVGGGLQVQYFEADLRNAQLFSATGFPPFIETVGFLQADDVAVGFTAGVLIEPSERTSIGIGYRSRISHDFDGKAGTALPDTTQTAHFNITTPDIVTASISHEVNDNLTLHGTLEWANWSLFDAIVVSFDTPTPTEVRPQDWADTWSGFAGLTYALDEETALSAGAGFTQATSNGTGSAISPDGDRTTVAIGLRRKVNDRLTLKAGYAHVFFKDTNLNIASPSPVTGTLMAVTDMGIDIAGVSATVNW